MPYAKDGSFKKAKVHFYSGYKGEETPRAIIIDNEEVVVQETLSRKRTFNAHSGEVQEIFICKTKQGIVKLRELAGGEWLVRFL
jgi:hypothetical protein